MAVDTTTALNYRESLVLKRNAYRLGSPPIQTPPPTTQWFSCFFSSKMTGRAAVRRGRADVGSGSKQYKLRRIGIASYSDNAPQFTWEHNN